MRPAMPDPAARWKLHPASHTHPSQKTVDSWPIEARDRVKIGLRELTSRMIERGDSLSVLAYKRLEEMILSGELKPGERINEARFASANGLSRGPVREACRALESAALVTMTPAKGAYVREISDKHLDEVYDLRAALTGMMCGLAAANKPDPSACDRLERLNAEMTAAADRKDTEGYYAANLKFHDIISDLAGNDTARRVYDGLVKETHWHRVAVLSAYESIEEHTAIIAAIRAGDQEEARRCGEAHVVSGKRRWIKRRVDQEASAGKKREEAA
jgi:DNA-binding GntR family transcriptional regulator